MNEPEHLDPLGPPKRRLRPRPLVTLLVTAGVIIILLTLALIASLARSDGQARTAPSPAGSSASSSSPATITLRGTITMDRYEEPRSEFSIANWRRVGTIGCEGTGGYDDMVEGVSVTAFGASGEVIGVGGLREGVRVGEQCAWAFEIGGVPDQSFYQVEVSHRGKVSVARASVGTISLRLG